MAADYKKLTEDLRGFYDFTEKVVLFVGAGGGHLLDPCLRTKKLIAIDKDIEALEQLEANLAAKGMQDSIDVVCAKFEDVSLFCDVVYFEFCLYEMDDPNWALSQAAKLAPEIVVFDHTPDSEWVFHAAEEEKVRRSSEAMERFGIRRRETFRTEQAFRNYAELLAKLSLQGPIAIERARKFTGETGIIIPMSYQVALL